MGKRGHGQYWPGAAIASSAVILITLAGAGSEGWTDPREAMLSPPPPDIVTVTTPVALLSRPRLVLERGELSKLQGPLGETATGRTPLPRRLTLDDALLSLDFPSDEPSAAGERTPDTVAEPLMAAVASANFDVLTIRRGTIRLGGSGDLLENVNADFTTRGGTPSRAAGTVRFRGQDVAFEAVLGGQAAAGRPIKLVLKNTFIAVSLDGRIAPGNTFELVASNAEVGIPSLRNIARWLGAAWPGGQGLIDFRAKGPLTLSGGSIGFEEASFELDGNKATGTLQLALGGARPAIEGTLALPRLDLTPYLGTSNTRAESSPASSDQGPWSILRRVDADIRISADGVVTPGGRLENCAASLSLKDGRLLADIAGVELAGGGSGNGQVSVDATSDAPRISVRGRLERLDGASVTRALFGHEILRGHLDLSAELAGAGGSTESLIGTLDGKVALALPGGGALGFDSSLLSKAAQSPETAGWGDAGGGQTLVEHLTGTFVLADGMASAVITSSTPDGLALSASGTVSLPARRLDLTLALGTAGAGTVAEAPHEIITMSGPWTGPRLKWDRPPKNVLAPPPLAPPVETSAVRPPSEAPGAEPVRP